MLPMSAHFVYINKNIDEDAAGVVNHFKAALIENVISQIEHD